MSSEIDVIGPWSEVKLDIVKDYAAAYSKILNKQTNLELHAYIDAFAGPGIHKLKATGKFVRGSPLNALLINPPFKMYYLIDLNGNKIKKLQELAGEGKNVFIFQGDCNTVLLEKVFPQVLYSDRRRALCLLDPYGLDLDWNVIKTAGHMESIEIFLNFPIHDMNRNALLRDPSKVSKQQRNRMNRYWGDDTWSKLLYVEEGKRDLFRKEKMTNDEIAEVFRKRLQEVAKFKFVPAPLPIRNQNNAIIYYLFFASQNSVGLTIVNYIFNKHNKSA